jgi:4-hydroxy-tetrahydrodipicolinate reductase
MERGKNNMINIAVTGAAGRMGSKIIKNILEQDDMNIAAAVETPDTPLEGKDIGEVIGVGNIGVEITPANKLEEVLTKVKPDVLVDFTIANAAVKTIKTASINNVNLVVGTTGFSDEEMTEIKEAITLNKVKAVIAPNMAVGVNVFFKVIKDLAPILSDYDIEIIEAHHKHKRDAPSGTAVKVFEIIAHELEDESKKTCVYGRNGLVGERTAEEIGMHAIRGGDIIGDHTVLFAGDGERLEITHRASSRQAFVNGVMKAVRYIPIAEKGKISDMADVLGLK